MDEGRDNHNDIAAQLRKAFADYALARVMGRGSRARCGA